MWLLCTKLVSPTTPAQKSLLLQECEQTRNIYVLKKEEQCYLCNHLMTTFSTILYFSFFIGQI